MIKLKDFTEAVDIYKKNFVLRKKRYESEQRSAIQKRRKEREDRIEPNKFLNNAGKNIGEGVKKITSGSDNFLNKVYKFLGFTLLGLIVKNLEKILTFVKTVVDKLKEAFTKIKEFYTETLEPALTSIFEGVGNIMETFGDVFNFAIDINPLKNFGDLLNTVMMGILSIGYRLGNRFNPVKPRSLPPGAGGAATGSSLTPKQVAAREAAKATAEEAKRKAAMREAANLKRQAAVATGSTRRRLLKEARRIEKFVRQSKPLSQQVGGTTAVGGAASTMTLDPPGPRTPRSITKEFADDLKASKLAADAARPGSASSFKSFLKSALDRNFREQGISNPAVSGITEDIARSNMFDDLAREFADEFENKKPFSTVGKESPTAPRGKLMGPNILKGVFGPKDLLNQKSLNLLRGLDFRFTLDDLARTFTFQNIKSGIKGAGIGLIIEFMARGIAKGVSDSLPYGEGNEIFGMFGLISKERIAKLRAQQLFEKSPRDKIAILKKLNADAQSKPFFLDQGGKNKKAFAEMILREYLKLTLGDELNEQPSTDPTTRFTPPPQTKTPPALKIEPSTEEPSIIKPGMLVPGEYTPEELKQLEEIQRQYGSQSSISKPTMLTSVNRSMSDGLDGETSYGSQGMLVIRQNHFVIQPVRVTA